MLKFAVTAPRPVVASRLLVSMRSLSRQWPPLPMSHHQSSSQNVDVPSVKPAARKSSPATAPIVDDTQPQAFTITVNNAPWRDSEREGAPTCRPATAFSHSIGDLRARITAQTSSSSSSSSPPQPASVAAAAAAATPLRVTDGPTKITVFGAVPQFAAVVEAMRAGGYEFEVARVPMPSVPERKSCALIASESGAVQQDALDSFGPNNAFFVRPGDHVYYRQIIGENPLLRHQGWPAHVTRILDDAEVAKIGEVTTDVRAMDLEEMLRWLHPCELLTATPKALRMRNQSFAGKSVLRRSGTLNFAR